MAPTHEYQVPFDGSFSIKKAPTRPPKGATKGKEAKAALEPLREELYNLQRQLFAHNRYAVLAVFQAMDAAGKDSTIRHVMRGVNPAGCQVYSFKSPSAKELDHDFLWRVQKSAPQRGRIGVFNRSHYEEVLVVRVHPQFLRGQNLPRKKENGKKLWKRRYESIRNWESHLAENGTVVLKFFLHVSKDAQAKRFLDRIREPESNWKFNPADMSERKLWNEYMSAYEDALNETSRTHAPWYAIPADDKPFMRLTVATILRDTLKSLPLSYPEADATTLASMSEYEAQLTRELG